MPASMQSLTLCRYRKLGTSPSISSKLAFRIITAKGWTRWLQLRGRKKASSVGLIEGLPITLQLDLSIVLLLSSLRKDTHASSLIPYQSLYHRQLDLAISSFVSSSDIRPSAASLLFYFPNNTSQSKILETCHLGITS